MTKEIETKEQNIEGIILTGEVDIPNKRIHIFRSMQAMTDFVNTFKISSGQWRTGNTPDGVWAVELVYDVSMENI